MPVEHAPLSNASHRDWEGRIAVYLVSIRLETRFSGNFVFGSLEHHRGTMENMMAMLNTPCRFNDWTLVRTVKGTIEECEALAAQE